MLVPWLLLSAKRISGIRGDIGCIQHRLPSSKNAIECILAVRVWIECDGVVNKSI